MLEILSSIGRGLSSLAFPDSCAGCSAPGLSICEDCAPKLNPMPQLMFGERFPIYSSLVYGKIEAQVLLSAKEDGNRRARNIVVDATAKSIELMTKVARVSGQISIVGVPASRSSIRRRGFNFMELVAQEVVELLNLRYPSEFRNERVLRVRRRVQDQSGLTAAERSDNLYGAFQTLAKVDTGTPIIVVDDVITTGSTIREAVRALHERNLTVIGAATAFASQRRFLIR